jgi:ketosteroid isomerase-like protein
VAENLDLVRSILARWERGEYGAAEWAHPELEFEIRDLPARGASSGLEQAGRLWHEFLSAWQDHQVEADEYRELDGGRVLVLGHFGARGRTSGLEVGGVRTKGANLFHLRDGLVTRLVVYFDQEHALRDLGLDG